MRGDREGLGLRPGGGGRVQAAGEGRCHGVGGAAVSTGQEEAVLTKQLLRRGCARGPRWDGSAACLALVQDGRCRSPLYSASGEVFTRRESVKIQGRRCVTAGEILELVGTGEMRSGGGLLKTGEATRPGVRGTATHGPSSAGRHGPRASRGAAKGFVPWDSVMPPFCPSSDVLKGTLSCAGQPHALQGG